ncbi:MAG: hypothetical protein F6J87_11040 [Spirulina sp. SIO3F2]|nr:hypothetical protein [Spirulina sp. SIO3F2]
MSSYEDFKKKVNELLDQGCSADQITHIIHQHQKLFDDAKETLKAVQKIERGESDNQ